MLRTSVLIAMIMLLKAHLKNLYGLSEEYVIVTAHGAERSRGLR